MGHYPNISAERVYANKPVTEDLLDDLRDSADYNYEHGVRAGTDAVGVRMALARGTVEIYYTGSGLDYETTGTVTFATVGHAEDGDPNFGASPIVTFGFEALDESVGVFEDWTSADGIRGWSVCLTALSDTAFSYRILFDNDAVTQIHGNLHWTAIGFVTAGE